MELRQMATAFIFHQDNVLMIKKSPNKFSDVEFWSGLGGHLEPHELNDPMRACLREIYEESGIEESEIHDLKLRYILLRIKNDEIRQQYVYFGNTDQTQFINSEEGELHWIPSQALLGLHMSSIIRFMLYHFLETPNNTGMLVGTITLDSDERPAIQWAVLTDPHVF
ncbi:hypothetical protein BVG16_27250 [Paenibacillus selenitireducens]|uniref:Nudix hydrolase domain-containing protein n=1 Tax=Paenibacillus selenitireducens TaxID=1324314 RepID=A0A1T2X1Q2_9BACL|nr:NUDIX domain-containing protein [Paenibacillus selenitireducens]OPA73782.1 hypothetical protein BVG16_27250 [Paenibacillus selenitireducens]